MQLYTKTSNQKWGAGLLEAMENMLEMENLKSEVSNWEKKHKPAKI